MTTKISIKKIFVSGLFFLNTTICISQSDVQTDLSDSGKAEFKRQATEQVPDYTDAYRILANQVKLDPINPELHYFLGYTIDRMNSGDGESMVHVTRKMTARASQHFETVNRLEPFYKGELYLLDPYSKLTSIWASLAQAYLYRQMSDSAIWAFHEGKKRGGFIEPILEYNRQILKSCNRNSMLISIGDNITFSLWYLQAIEKFRTDIIILDANLLHSIWYPRFLKSQGKVKFSFTDIEIDSIQYIDWETKQFTLRSSKNKEDSLSWQLKPTYLEQYLLRGDRILLDILEQNYFDKEIYFVSNSDSTNNLFLNSNFVDEGLVSRITNKKTDTTNDAVEIPTNFHLYTIENLKAEEIQKSRDAVYVLSDFRLVYCSTIYKLFSRGDFKEAKQLLKEMERKFGKEKLPYASDEQERYFEQLIEILKSK